MRIRGGGGGCRCGGDPLAHDQADKDIGKDYDTLPLTVAADFDAPVERVWRLWSDPRLPARWWGGAPA